MVEKAMASDKCQGSSRKGQVTRVDPFGRSERYSSNNTFSSVERKLRWST